MFACYTFGFQFRSQFTFSGLISFRGFIFQRQNPVSKPGQQVAHGRVEMFRVGDEPNSRCYRGLNAQGINLSGNKVSSGYRAVVLN